MLNHFKEYNGFDLTFGYSVRKRYIQYADCMCKRANVESLTFSVLIVFTQYEGYP